MMTFRATTLLWLLAIVPFALVFFIARERLRARIARRFVSERLRGRAGTARALRPWLLALSLAAAIVALAGPYSGYRLVPIVTREANRIVLIDVSNSMGAQDVGTSRLAAAKALARRIVDRHAGRVALIIFELDEEVVAPLTSDTVAVATLIDTLQLGEVDQPGSDIGGAVLGALQLAENEAAATDMIVISDGEDQGTRTPIAIAQAQARNIVVHTILLGTATGATIPTDDGAMTDGGGNIITTYAKPAVLRSLAAGTGGRFLENPFAAEALDVLGAGRGSRTERAQTREVRVPLDRYQWPLGFAFLAFLLGSLANRGAE